VNRDLLSYRRHFRSRSVVNCYCSFAVSVKQSGKMQIFYASLRVVSESDALSGLQARHIVILKKNFTDFLINI